LVRARERALLATSGTAGALAEQKPFVMPMRPALGISA
jgi:hypothetical protein